MTSRTKIAELCQEILDNEPEEEVAKASPLQPAAEQLESAPESAGESVRAVQPEAAPEASKEDAEGAKDADYDELHRSDAEMAELVADREQRLGKRMQMQRAAVWLILLALFGGAATSYCVSPTLRGKVDWVVDNVKKSKNDIQTIGNITEEYDEALAEIKKRGSHVADATRQMGVDPDSVDPNDDPNMEAEMAMLMGEDATSTADRNRSLQNTFGLVGKLAGDKMPGQPEPATTE